MSKRPLSRHLDVIIPTPPKIKPELCGCDAPVADECQCGRRFCGECECDCADAHNLVADRAQRAQSPENQASEEI